MSKPVKTEAELIAMAKAELKVHLDCPDGIVISTIRDGDSWEFRASAGEATIAKPGYPECVAMLVQIGDHLCKQYDLKGEGVRGLKISFSKRFGNRRNSTGQDSLPTGAPSFIAASLPPEERAVLFPAQFFGSGCSRRPRTEAAAAIATDKSGSAGFHPERKRHFSPGFRLRSGTADPARSRCRRDAAN